MKQTEYKIFTDAFGKNVCFAVLSDLHGQDPTEAIAALRRARPDYSLMPGDIFEKLDGTMDDRAESGFCLLEAATKIAPTFLSIGNHENGGIGSWRPDWRWRIREETEISEQNLERIRKSGAILLRDEWVMYDGIAFGGLSSGLAKPDHLPRVDWLDGFCALDAPRVLLCHHPEYYPKYLKALPIDLTVSGHAHGGQWRVFGRGVFAPGQGLFPKYTRGLYDGRLVVSAGIKKGGRIPRIFNEPEIVFLTLFREKA